MGFFGNITNATIQNIKFDNITVKFSGNSGDNTAAVVGRIANGKISNIVVTNGAINGNFYAGGIIGEATNTTIDNVKFNGRVSNKDNYYVWASGGILGHACGGSSSMPPISMNQCCVVDSNIIGADRAGGLIGEIRYATVNINNCYTTGTVTAGRYGGGICYPNETRVNKITNSYSFMRSNIVPICPRAGTVSNVYWNKTKSGLTSSACGTHIADDKLNDQNSYVGFDFENIWVMKDGIPRLQWEDNF